MILKLQHNFTGWYFIDDISNVSIKHIDIKSEYLLKTDKNTGSISETIFKDNKITGSIEEPTFKLNRVLSYKDPDIKIDIKVSNVIKSGNMPLIEEYEFSNLEHITKEDQEKGRIIKEEYGYILFIKFNDSKKESIKLLTNSTGYLLNDDGKTIQHIIQVHKLN